MKKLLFAAGAATILLAASASSASEVLDYQLNGTLTDENNNADITNNGAALGASGLTFDNNQGPTIGGFANTGIYSIETSFSLDDTAGYNKVLDFLGRGPDSGLYVINGALQFYGVSASAGTFAAGALTHLVVTRDAANTFTAYLNGGQVFSVADLGFSGVITSSLRFFSDDFATSQGEASPGFVDYIRTYDTALSAGDVGELYRTGGLDAGVPEPTAWALMIMGFGGVGAMVRRRRGSGVRLV